MSTNILTTRTLGNDSPVAGSTQAMANLGILLQGVLAALAATVAHGAINVVPLPLIDLNKWWGAGPPGTDDPAIYPFQIQFKQSMIDDLKRRLTNVRPFTPTLEGANFDYGYNATVLELWRQYILNNYPFADRQAFLNQYNHYTTQIQGLKIHFMRVTANITNTSITKLTPLLIVHGHPGSIREFYEAVPYLMSIGQSHGIAFDIIMPSLPGYTFSEAPAKPGCGVDQVAIIFRNLMHRLGYSKYYIQGGDMGSIVTNCIATFFQDECLGYHSNFPLYHTWSIVAKLIEGNWHKDEVADPRFWPQLYPSLDRFIWVWWRTGYLHFQSTKPDTFGTFLSDSPIGHLAHTQISVGPPTNTGTVTAVQLIDNWLMYWSTNCYTTAIRLYSETFNWRYVNLRINEIRTTVPTWLLQAPNELLYLPGWMLKDKFPNLLNVTEPATGGHFYAWALPQDYAQNVVDACVAFNEWHEENDPSSK